MTSIVKSTKRLISAKLLLPIFWAFKKLPVFNLYGEFTDRQWDSGSDFHKRQAELLRRLLEHAVTKIQYYKDLDSEDYRRLFQEDPWEALKKMPVMTKDVLRNELNSLHGDLHRDTFINSSGGSTGEPVRLYQDKVYLANILAAKMSMYEWAGHSPGGSMVKLWGAERDLLHGKTGIKQIAIDFINNIKTVNAFRLSPERMKKYVNEINRTRPDCIEGYAESLYEFSVFIRDYRLKVFSPGSIVSSAGTLHPHMRDSIQQVFGTRVFDRYGSREAGDMAGECEEHNGLHVFGETTILEIVDKDGKHVDIGEEGEILVTCLCNYTMPLIRYQIGDRAIRGKDECTCGRPYPLVERIVGRSGASFKTRDGGVVSPEFFIHLIGVMCNDGNVGKFQVVQEDYSHILIRIAPAPGSSIDSWNEEAKAKKLIRSVMGDECKIDVVLEKEIELTPTGKHLYTICNIK